MLDVEALKAPIGDPAVGPELRGEVEFGEIEEMPRGFGSMTPAELAKTIAKCGQMFAQSKDQTFAIVALEAAARVGDLAEMRAALALIEHCVTDHWDDYHPGPADEMSEARLNELAALKRRAALLLPLSKLHIAKLPGPGDNGFTIGMVRVATAPVAAWSDEDETKLGEMVEKGNATRIEADLQRTQRERGRVLRGIARTIAPAARVADSNANISFEDLGDIPDAENIARALVAQVADKAAPLFDFGDALLGIDEAFDSRMGANPGLAVVASECYAMAKACQAFAEAFAEPEPGSDVAATAGDDAAPVAASGGPAPRGAALGLDSVRNRADVITAMDAVIRYYTEHEPSSPVPVMMRRLKGWVNKDFLEVMRDLAPNQVDELTRLLVSPEY
jgi:predicted component of type VI protein secretion system